MFTLYKKYRGAGQSLSGKTGGFKAGRCNRRKLVGESQENVLGGAWELKGVRMSRESGRRRGGEWSFKKKLKKRLI